MSTPIPLAVPRLAGNELSYLRQCIETNFVSTAGGFVDRFEREFAKAVGVSRAVACTSGTAALHVALRLAGAGPDKTVAVSTFTFIASANAITYTGATPLLVDSETSTWNMDTARLHDVVVKRAQAGDTLPEVIEVVHILGHPADLEPLIDLQQRFGISIVEDAAEALGATYTSGQFTGRHVGTIGDFGCYSFNGNKIITTGGGGMIVAKSDADAAAAKHLTEQAKLPGPGYLHDDVGYNYRLTNTSAAIGVAQLEQLEEFVAAKRQIAQWYRDRLQDLPVGQQPTAPWANPTHWLYSVLLDPDVADRDHVVGILRSEGIQARPLWPPLGLQDPYRSAQSVGGEVARDLYQRGISLPCSVGITEQDVDRVSNALRSALSS
jgi:dTDP-4-amino-4,6-dideoxygalactose transaminase